MLTSSAIGGETSCAALAASMLAAASEAPGGSFRKNCAMSALRWRDAPSHDATGQPDLRAAPQRCEPGTSLVATRSQPFGYTRA
jgi:hypothetical protein